MGKAAGLLRHVFTLALMLLFATACARADASRKRFDIPSQPAASGLNEFARQADITLFFSYDLVAGVRTRALKGDYTVVGGLTLLLDGTGLAHRQNDDGAYLICRPPSCDATSVSREVSRESEQFDAADSDGGKRHEPRLNDKPVTTPGS